MKQSRVTPTAKTALLAASLVCLSACSEKKPATNAVDVAAIKAMHLASSEKAEKLALAAEQLVSAKSFMYADTVLSAALNADAKNARALFYQKALAPVLKLKGIATRVRPFMTAEERSQFDGAIKSAPNSGIKTFLLDGREDLKAESDIQALIDDVIEGLDGFREHIKATKDQELTLNVPESFQDAHLQKVADTCAVTEVRSEVYELVGCDLSGALQINVNRADKEVLQQTLAGMLIYLKIGNAYRADGLIALGKSKKEIRLDSREVRAYLQSQPNWGILRNSHYMTSILGMGLDAVTGIRWLQANQNSLCPKGENARGRTGHLVQSSICVENTSGVQRSLGIAETLLKGGIWQMPISSEKSKETVAVRPSAIFANPTKDLKDLMTIQTDECGRLVSAKDPSFGGMFPDRDATKVFPSKCETGAGR